MLDNPGAPDVFADAVAGAFLTNGNVHMTFLSRRCDYSQNPNVFTDVIIGRLVMPFAAVENAVNFLSDFVERMKKQLANPPDAPRTLQ
jgi:hypothetical protein